jgi:hypothetical protein
LTFQHRAGVRPYTSAHAFAEPCVFGKQSLPPLCCNHTRLQPKGLHPTWHTLSRSYGVSLPSSLTRVLSSASVFSTRPPESVSGTVAIFSSQYAAFLGSVGSSASARRPPHHVSALGSRFVPTTPAYSLAPGFPSPGLNTLLRPRSAPRRRFRNIDLISIGLASRLRLRCRLTLPG